MIEFSINRYLKLKLIKGKTYIYINEKRFLQCKFLLLNIPIDEIKYLNEIDSIDDAAETLDNSLDPFGDKIKVSIPPRSRILGALF